MNIATLEFRSAFIALVGRPNGGKSSLLNTILGENLSIVTPMPQTTQRIMRGIYNGDGYQLVFIDTPGIHRGSSALSKALYRKSTRIFTDAGIDILCYIVDLSRHSGKEEDEIARQVEKMKMPVCIVFNKIDLCKSAGKAVEAFFSKYPGLRPFPNVPLSAITPDAKIRFLKTVDPFIPIGPQYYPTEYITDSNLRFFAAEFIRKQIIDMTCEEVPHASCVEILDYKEYEDRHVVTATVHVETQGQKGIVIGKKGTGIKQIEKRAAADLQKLTGMKTSVACHVKVSPRWRDNKQFLVSMGLDVK
jgi:GTP-binding protein Era